VAARHGHAALAAVLRAKTGPSKKERRRAQQRQDAPPAAV
jgi:ribosomal protein L32